ncbi:hypothetical protein IFM89_037194 [Coptis chinensis]|uniref:Uncharacterized protein n=1 Tax=Coptis chinensis TaxID=261450 RepID=A0A835HM47_9MAGN|nr:hypothetical protein IFM89_037194 [Coptis chinensis]
MLVIENSVHPMKFSSPWKMLTHHQLIEEKAFRQLLQFSFQELKSATGNFRPDSIIGEGGFGFVFKGWIEENSPAPAKPGSVVTVAVKKLEDRCSSRPQRVGG